MASLGTESTSGDKNGVIQESGINVRGRTIHLELPRPLVGHRGRARADEDGGGGRGLAPLLVDLQLRLVDHLLHEEVGLGGDVRQVGQVCRVDVQ